MLNDDDKALAKTLGLSQQEARFSLATRIPLTRYAEIKAQIAEEADAKHEYKEQFNAAMVERAAYFAAYGRGVRPNLEEAPPEEGG